MLTYGYRASASSMTAIEARACRWVACKTSDVGSDSRKLSTRRRMSRHIERSRLESASWLASEFILSRRGSGVRSGISRAWGSRVT